MWCITSIPKRIFKQKQTQTQYIGQNKKLNRISNTVRCTRCKNTHTHIKKARQQTNFEASFFMNTFSSVFIICVSIILLLCLCVSARAFQRESVENKVSNGIG